MNAQDMLAAYFESQADWQNQQAAEHPEDPRHEREAEQFRDRASWVLDLPDDQEDIRVLQTLMGRRADFSLDTVVQDEEASWLASHVGSHQSNASFLHALVDAIVSEEGEHDIRKLGDDE
jgi:hypothetical protein